jgi:hypothetical protein
VAQHEQQPRLQAMDQMHQQQMAQFAAANQPQPNGQG